MPSTAKKITDAAAPTEGNAAPQCNLMLTGDKTTDLASFKGKKNVVLYFYPKDDTPGCTIEAKDFASLAKEFEIPPQEAQSYIDGFFQQYPLVEAWMNKIVQQAQACGYVESLWGKRRYISELQSANKTHYNTGRRYAINTPVQGTQADIVKIAMINIAAEFNKKKLLAAIILQIHDEIVIEFPYDEEAIVRQIVQHEMEHVVSWEIPLSVSIRTGINWAEVTK